MKTVVIRLLLLAALALPGTSCRYERDRSDEQVLGLTAEHYNLYRHAALKTPDGWPTPSAAAARRDYRVNMAQLLESQGRREPSDVDSYAMVCLLWENQAPLLQCYKTAEKQAVPELLFTIPINQTNARKIGETPDRAVTFQLLLSLRYDTWMPLFLKNNYEIFLMTLTYDPNSDDWRVSALRPLTDGKPDAIQPMFNADASEIAYVECSRELATELCVMTADGGSRRTVASGAQLPCYLASGKLLYVQSGALGRQTFMVHDPRTRRNRPAADSEVAEALRCLPYSALKSFYTQIAADNAEKSPPPPPDSRTFTFSEWLNYGLRNSPELKQASYNLTATRAQITQNLFDIGPDFFMGADYLVTSSMLTNDNNGDYYVIGDRIGQDNFVRGIAGLSIPVLPNLPLRWAKRYGLDRRKDYACATLLKALNVYLGKISALGFDYAQEQALIAILRDQLRANTERLRRYQALAAESDAYAERILFAENIHAALTGELKIAANNLIAVQAGIAATIGMDADRGLHLQPPPDGREIPQPTIDAHTVEWFVALAQVNRQELRELDAQMAQYAAERDMGPESTRIDAVRVSISYGVGWMEWQKLVDDFLLMGISYARPLRLPHFFQAYYDDWTARITALRMQKYAVAGQIRMDVFNAFTEYSSHSERAAHRRKRQTFLREQARLAELYRRYGNRYCDTPASTVEDFDAILTALDEQGTGAREQFAQWRRLIALYQTAGRADLLLPSVIAALELGVVPPPPATPEAPRTTDRAVYLWKSLEVITSKPAREKFLEFCARNKIHRVYCYVSMKADRIPFTVRYDEEYAYFIECCRRQDIRVIALMGEPEWLMPSERRDMFTLLNACKDFNERRRRRGAFGFSGCKLDVEPHSSPNWRNDRPSLMKNYLSMLDDAAAVVGKPRLFADVSYQYHQLPCPVTPGRDFLYEIGRRVGGMTVMAYLDNPDAVMSKMRPILARTDLNCPISAALETNNVGEPGISFFGQSRTDFMTAMSRCDAELSPYGNFYGIDIHDYNGFNLLY